MLVDATLKRVHVRDTNDTKLRAINHELNRGGGVCFYEHTWWKIKSKGLNNLQNDAS